MLSSASRARALDKAAKSDSFSSSVLSRTFTSGDQMPDFGVQPTGLVEKIFEQIGVGVVVIDHQEREVFANKRATEIFGGSISSSLFSFRDLRRNHRVENSLGVEVPFEDSAVRRALKGEHVESEELRVIFPDGSTKWFVTWAYPFSVMGLSGVLALVVDETAEVKLRRAASQLERMDTLGAIAAALTHDLNNILDTVSLNTACMIAQDVGTADSRARLNEISLATSKAAELLKRMMRFGRTQETHCRPVHINEVITEVLQFVHPLFRENIVVENELGKNLPCILADPSQLEQLLVNLIVNALDAMPNGGHLSISTSLQTEREIANSNGKHCFVRVTVADTGVGMSQELQSKIFEPFFTTKQPGKGTGLGLATAFGIVKQHNGELEVHSSPGSGAAFVISLPAYPP